MARIARCSGGSRRNPRSSRSRSATRAVHRVRPVRRPASTRRFAVRRRSRVAWAMHTLMSRRWSHASKRPGSRRPRRSRQAITSAPAGHPRPDRHRGGSAVRSQRAGLCRATIRSTYAARSPFCAASMRSRSTVLASSVAPLVGASDSTGRVEPPRRSFFVGPLMGLGGGGPDRTLGMAARHRRPIRGGGGVLGRVGGAGSLGGGGGVGGVVWGGGGWGGPVPGGGGGGEGGARGLGEGVGSGGPVPARAALGGRDRGGGVCVRGGWGGAGTGGGGLGAPDRAGRGGAGGGGGGALVPRGGGGGGGAAGLRGGGGGGGGGGVDLGRGPRTYPGGAGGGGGGG